MKAPTKCGCVVDQSGNILRAWSWNGDGDCPLEIRVDAGEIVFNLSDNGHDAIHTNLHEHKVDLLLKKIVSKKDTS